MRTLLAYLTVLVAAAVPWLEVLLVVPVGILAGLPLVPVVVVAAVGNIASLVPVVLGGDRLRAWWQRRRRRRAEVAAADGHGRDAPVSPAATDAAATDPHGRGGRAQRLTERYGLPGVALLGPLLTGIHVAAIAALAGGADKRATLVWASVGVAVWSAITGVATVVGIEALVDPDALPDLGL